jgi:hypothetical protein
MYNLCIFVPHLYRLQTDKEKLLILWLADQVPVSVANEKAIADKALKIAKENIKR